MSEVQLLLVTCGSERSGIKKLDKNKISSKKHKCSYSELIPIKEFKLPGIFHR